MLKEGPTGPGKQYVPEEEARKSGCFPVGACVAVGAEVAPTFLCLEA